MIEFFLPLYAMVAWLMGGYTVSSNRDEPPLMAAASVAIGVVYWIMAGLCLGLWLEAIWWNTL